MQLSLAKIASVIPDWNQRPLTETDFYRLAARFGVSVEELPLRVNGFYYQAAGRHVIAVNNRLPYQKKLFVMFHELGHFLLHSPQHSTAVGWYSVGRRDKKEREADAFALCAIWPRALVLRIVPADLSIDGDDAAAIFAARVRLLKKHGI